MNQPAENTDMTVVDDPEYLPTNQAGNQPQVIDPYSRMVELAIEKGDLDKLEKFMDLKQRHEDNEARKAFHVAMSAFKADPPEITKDKKVSYKNTQYSHASLANVTTTINKALGKHGLSATWKIDQDEKGKITVTATITHVMGHSESTSLFASPDTSGSKNAIQSVGSSITYLERYTILALTGLATHDMDDDGAASSSVKYLSDEQQSQITDLLIAVYGDDHSQFLDYIGHESVGTIPAKEFHEHYSGLTAIYKKRSGQ